MPTLNYRQRLFVAAFLDEARAAGNATEAARLAGYLSPEKYGCRVLSHPAVRASIAARLGAVALESDESLARLSELASSDIGEIIDIGEDGKTFSIDIAKAKRLKRTGSIRKLKFRRETRQDRDGTPIITDFVEVELYSKLDALDKLCRYHGLFKDRIDVTSADQSLAGVHVYLPDNRRDPGLCPQPVSSPIEGEGGDDA